MVTPPRSSDFLKSPTTHTLVAGDLEAVFLPDHGMLGASLRHRGAEILRRVEHLESAAARGSSAEFRFFIRGLTGLLSHGIVFWEKRLCSMCHRPFSTSTSMGFRCRGAVVFPCLGSD